MATTKTSFTSEELETLFAAFDTFLPPTTTSELIKFNPNVAYADEKALKEFAEQRPSELPNVRRMVTEVLLENISPAKIAELKMALNLLRYLWKLLFQFAAGMLS